MKIKQADILELYSVIVTSIIRLVALFAISTKDLPCESPCPRTSSPEPLLYSEQSIYFDIESVPYN